MKKIFVILAVFAIVTVVLYGCLVIYVRSFADGKVFEISDVSGNYDCILVLGAGVMPDGKPSFMLADRLDTGISLYNEGKSPKIIMSGDHGTKIYDEVNTMKAYAMERGVPSEDCFMDHAGFSTYESLYRAKEIFKAEKVIIVTQSYHLYRALFIAQQLGIDACGVSADTVRYSGQFYRNIRELAAYGKDFLWCLFEVQPTFSGEAIPVWGDGNATNDK